MYETFAQFQSPGFIMRYIPRGLAAVSEPSITFLLPASRVVKNPPASAGDTGSIPDPGRSHMPQDS